MWAQSPKESGRPRGRGGQSHGAGQPPLTRLQGALTPQFRSYPGEMEPAAGRACGGCRPPPPPPGGSRGPGAVPRSGVPRGGARGATAPRCRPRPRQPRCPGAPARALRREGRRRPLSVPSPPGWREGGGAGGGGRRRGGWPGSGGGQLPPGLGGVRPWGERSRVRGRLPRAGW